MLSGEIVIRPYRMHLDGFNFGRVRFQHFLLVLPQQCQISATDSVPGWEHLALKTR